MRCGAFDLQFVSAGDGLSQLWHAPAGRDRPRHFAIIGAGKTAMDVAIWLLETGVPPESISWVVPRDSWLLNRLQTQTGEEFFEHSIGGQANQMEACAKARSVDDLYERLEACGTLLRIDPAAGRRCFTSRRSRSASSRCCDASGM